MKLLKDAVEFSSKNYFLNHHITPKSMVLDWRHLELDDWPEIIIASDIAYEKRFQDRLQEVIPEWCEKGSTVVFSEPSRRTAKTFIETLKSHQICASHEEIYVDWVLVRRHSNS